MCVTFWKYPSPSYNTKYYSFTTHSKLRTNSQQEHRRTSAHIEKLEHSFVFRKHPSSCLNAASSVATRWFTRIIIPFPFDGHRNVTFSWFFLWNIISRGRLARWNGSEASVEACTDVSMRVGTIFCKTDANLWGVLQYFEFIRCTHACIRHSHMRSPGYVEELRKCGVHP